MADTAADVEVVKQLSPKSHTLSIPPYIASCIGATAGVTEILIQQPTIAIKNAIQTGRPIPFSISELYRGVVINALSIAPITATQFTVSNLLITNYTTHSAPPTPAQQIAFSTTAGAVSGLISGPAELVLIQQQQTGFTLYQQCAYIINNYPSAIIRRGMLSAITRDGLFTCGYMGLTPVVQQWISKSTYRSDNITVNNIAGSLIAGVSVGMLSHPIDTVKTKIQSTLHHQADGYNTMVQSLYKSVRTHGVKSLFQGLLPRTLRICGATFIISETNKYLTKQYVNRYQS